MSNGQQTEQTPDDVKSFLKRAGGRPAPEKKTQPSPDKPPSREIAAAKIEAKTPPEVPWADFLKKVGGRPAPETLTKGQGEHSLNHFLGFPAQPSTEPIGVARSVGTYWNDIKAAFQYPASVIERASEAAKKERLGATPYEIPGVLAGDIWNGWIEQLDRISRAQSSWDKHPSLDSFVSLLGQASAGALMVTFPVKGGAFLGPMIGAVGEEPDPYVAVGHGMAVVTFAAMPEATKTARRVIGRTVEVGKALKESGVRGSLQEITGTGPRLIGKAEEARAFKVTEQEAGYQKDLASAKEKQAELAKKIEVKHQATVDQIKRDYTDEVRRANEQKIEKSRAEGRRVALKRYYARTAKAYDENVKNTNAAVRSWLNDRWSNLRSKVGGDSPLDMVPVVEAVKHAKENILRGSQENIAIFNSILREGNTLEEATVFKGEKSTAGGRTDIPGTVNIAELSPEVRRRIGFAISEGTATSPAEVGFNDGRGYSTELGAKMNTGNLPGDVYHSLKYVRGSLEEQIEALTDSKGAGDEYRSLKPDWSQYMGTFHDQRPLPLGGSALARSLRAHDLPFSVRPILGPSGGRGLADFAKYKKFGADPNLGATLRRIDTQMKNLQKETPEVKPAERPAAGFMKSPEVPPFRPPVPPEEIPPVSPLAVTKEQLSKEASSLRRPSSFATALALFELLRFKAPIWLIYVLGRPFLANAYESERFARYLSETPEKKPPSGGAAAPPKP